MGSAQRIVRLGFLLTVVLAAGCGGGSSGSGPTDVPTDVGSGPRADLPEPGEDTAPGHDAPKPPPEDAAAPLDAAVPPADLAPLDLPTPPEDLAPLDLPAPPEDLAPLDLPTPPEDLAPLDLPAPPEDAAPPDVPAPPEDVVTPPEDAVAPPEDVAPPDVPAPPEDVPVAEDVPPPDHDGDGYAAPDDCDDHAPLVHPGAEEVCANGVDDDCSGTPDDRDGDEDGWVATACGGDDCDDAEPAVHPGADDVENGRDDDCDALVDEGSATPSFEADEDFETGDLARFPWQTESDAGHAWQIETAAEACHGGSFCARTSPFHVGGETSALWLPLSVREDTTVSFWLRTETEPGQHLFTFSVDDEPLFVTSGAEDWQLVTFDVPATGAGGPDRLLRFEYSRSEYVDSERPPWTTVWIDDIDLPAWNTPPTVPELLRPANGALLADDTPTFVWRSLDPDYDAIIYEVQWDDDPAFPTPTTTGETLDRTRTAAPPFADGAVVFWRARAKDVSDYRWSAWSATSSLRVATEDEYGVRWRQATGPEFALDSHVHTEVEGDSVRVSGDEFVRTGGVMAPENQALVAFPIADLPPARAGASGTFTVSGSMFVDYVDCYNCRCCLQETGTVYLTVDGTNIGDVTNRQDNCSCSVFGVRSLTIPDVAAAVADGTVTVQFLGTASNYQCYQRGNTFCGYVSYSLAYDAVGEGDVTSPPIRLADFDGRPGWEKAFVSADPGTTFQVLDGDRALVPDEAVPGNSAGLPPGTVHLFHLDGAAYPVIHLRAHLTGSARLSAWEVYANDGYRWHFGNPGEAEGWSALADGATPTVTVADGVLRMEVAAEGTDPRLVYTLPAAVDASRFRTMTVRLRTSNHTANDTVSFFWENNYGAFDPVRSLAETAFLYEFRDVTFDLTQAATFPAQPWQGRVTAIRVDPVALFFDAVGAAAAGWAEVDSVWLR